MLQDLIHRKTATDEEFRDYDKSGVLRRLHKVGRYEVLYNEKGLREHKININGIEEFWEYDQNNQLYKWSNTKGHERRYVCGESGKITAWFCNEALISWYEQTGRKFDHNFAGLMF